MNIMISRFLPMAVLAMLQATLLSSVQAADCRVTLSRPLVDYGKLVPGEGLHAMKGSLYPLNEDDVVVSAFCSEPQKMGLFFSGSPQEGGFLFGNNGVLFVAARQATLDGKSVRLGKSAGQGVLNMTGTAQEMVVVQNNNGLLPIIDQEVASGQQFRVTLRLKPLMNAAGLKPADQTLIKSNLSILVVTE